MNTFFEDTINTPDTEETQQEAASIGEIVDSVDGGMDKLDDFLKFMVRMGAGISDDCDDDEDEDESDSGMDANEYHNKACDYAHRGKTKQAADVCLKALKRFPMNVDLLADTVRYSFDSGDMKTAAKYYAVLKNTIPFSCWNWRAYTFSIDYLLGENPAENEAECRMLVENYKKFIPYEERACVAESELEMAVGHSERSMEVLMEAVATRTNASQCALRLADLQMNRSMFEDVINTANYGIAASAEAQPSINAPYLYYLRALAKDHLIHKKEYVHHAVSCEEVCALEKEYKLLLEKFTRQMIAYAPNIKTHMSMLAFIQTTD